VSRSRAGLQSPRRGHICLYEQQLYGQRSAPWAWYTHLTRSGYGHATRVAGRARNEAAARR
jgi:hypothetical protein